MENKKLVILGAGTAVLTALYLLIPEFAFLLRGAMQALFGGNSFGKLLFASAWFAVIPFIVIGVKKTRISEKINVHNLEKIFAAIVIAGFALGFIQLLIFTNQFDSFIESHGAMIDSENYKNWEASGYSHNHFPKITLKFIEKTSGLDFGGKFDDGGPFYELVQFPEAWSLAFIVVLVLLLISGILLLTKEIEKTSTVGFIAFSAGLLGIFIRMIDGGVLENGIPFVAFFFLVWWVEKKNNKAKTDYLIPCLGTGFFAMLMISTGFRSYSGTYPLSLAMFLSLAYYFVRTFQQKKLEINWGNAGLAIILIFTANLSFGLLMDFSYGLNIEGQNQGIFIYGIPDNSESKEVLKTIKEFGTVKEFKREGWLAYAIIDADKSFRPIELQNRLVQKLKPETYLYAMKKEVMPLVKRFKVHWFQEVDDSKFIKQKFLDIEVIEKSYDPENQTTTVTLKSKTNYQTWSLLALLSHIRENGFEGKMLVHTT